MHTFGHPVDLDAVTKVCANFHIALIEDAAEALGSYYKGKHVGHWGRLTALSFNGNKIVTTGGGGALLTADPDLAKAAKHLSTTAKLPHPWAFFHDQSGFNYRLPNINAALGCAQLEQLPKFLEAKRNLAERYAKDFEHMNGVHFFKEPVFAKSNYWLNALRVDGDQCEKRDAIIALAHENGIRLRPAWTLLNKLPMFSDFPKMDLSTAERIEATLINLPSSASL